MHEIDLRQKRWLSGIESPFFTIGRLEWVAQDKEVRFIPKDPDNPTVNDNWVIYRLPNEKWKNKNYMDRYNFLNPDDTSPYLYTCDPIDYRNYIAEGSKAAITVGSMLDSSLPEGGLTVDARWLFRPNNPNDVIENVRMAAIFWAAKGAPENNKAWLAEDLVKGRDDHMNNRVRYNRFMLTYDKDLKTFRQMRYTDKSIAGIFTGPNSSEGYVRDGNVFLKEPRATGEKDNLSNIWDAELLKQLRKFDPKNTQKSDLAIAFLIFTQILKNYNRSPQTKQLSYLSNGSLLKSWYGIKEEQKVNVGRIGSM